MEQLNPIFTNNCKNELLDFISKYKIFQNIDNNKCIIIGNNNSIKKYIYGNYIDNSSYSIIRINFNLDNNLLINWGTKIDLAIYYKDFYKHSVNQGYNIKIIDRRMKDIIFDNIIKRNIKLFSSYQYHFTTGFMIIILAIFYFKEIQIYGFGEYNKKDELYKNGFIKSVHNKQNINYDQKQKYHDIDLEHEFIDLCEDNSILKRLESNRL